MIKKITLFLVLTMSLAAELSAQNTHVIRFEMSAANMNTHSFLDGQKILIEYGRNLDPTTDFVAGFSLSRTINEVMSDDPAVVENPERIREGYNGSSLDIFSGFNISFWERRQLSLSGGIGFTGRVRSENYADPDSEIDVQPVSMDDSGNQIYGVFTEVNYERSFDLGLYGNFTVGYNLKEQWKIAINNRYSFYTKGFSINSLGISGTYSF